MATANYYDDEFERFFGRQTPKNDIQLQGRMAFPGISPGQIDSLGQDPEDSTASEFLKPGKAAPGAPFSAQPSAATKSPRGQGPDDFKRLFDRAANPTPQSFSLMAQPETLTTLSRRQDNTSPAENCETGPSAFARVVDAPDADSSKEKSETQASPSCPPTVASPIQGDVPFWQMNAPVVPPAQNNPLAQFWAGFQSNIWAATSPQRSTASSQEPQSQGAGAEAEETSWWAAYAPVIIILNILFFLAAVVILIAVLSK